MGPFEKPPHDCPLCFGRNLFIGGDSLRDNRTSPDPRTGVADDCCCSVAEPNYLCACHLSGTRSYSAVGALRATSLPRLLFREDGEQHLDHHCGYPRARTFWITCG